MQKARRHSANAELRPRVSAWFQGLFHFCISRFFSPFPHGTGTLSVFQEYLALSDGSDSFTQDLTCPALLRIPLSLYTFTNTGLSPPMVPFSKGILIQYIANVVVLQPRFCLNKNGLGFFQFARRYYGNHYCFLFLRVLRCFSSPG